MQLGERMSVIELLVVLVVVGVLVYLMNHLVPIDPKFKTVINVVIGLALLLWLLELFGIIGPWHIGHLRGYRVC